MLLYERLFVLYAQSIEESIDTALKKQRKTRAERSASGAGLINKGRAKRALRKTIQVAISKEEI